MQLQFQKTVLPCLHRLKGETQSREETQELRLPEEMPDIGVILGAWGQMILRGKQWRSRSAELSCGVMAWVLYLPEDGGQPQVVEGWLPMNLDWDLPESDRDGTMQVRCFLKSVDARPVSGRRLMLRACAEVHPTLWMPGEMGLYTPADLPADIRLLEKTHCVVLPREVGEKSFALEEELTLPDSAPAMDKLLRYSLYPEEMEQKVLSDKVVFRGVGHLHMLYQNPEGMLHSYDFQIPFSQYAELEQAYDQAEAQIALEVTSLELEVDGMGRLQLKAGLTGQYLVTDSTAVKVVEDAYSPDRSVTVKTDELLLPVMTGEMARQIQAKAAVPLECRRVADVAFWPAMPRLKEGNSAELSGQFQILCYDDTGTLQSAAPKWQDTQPLSPENAGSPCLTVSREGIPQAVLGPETTLTAQLVLQGQWMENKGLPMVTALEVGEATQPDPNRPSLILRRAGEDSLWQLARSCGSTVEAIRAANHLTDDPAPDQMLLIPVL